MNITLTITGSAATLARVLCLLDGQPVAVAAEADPDQIELPLAAEFKGGLVKSDKPYIVGENATESFVPVATPVMPEVSEAAPTVPGEPEFDSSGLAWDERIHSAQRGTTNDGRWRKRRNVDDAVYNAVEAELRARYGQVAQPTPVAPVAVAQPVPVAPVATPVMPMPSVNDEGNDQNYEYVATAPVADVAVAASEPQPVTVPVVPVTAPAVVAAPEPVTAPTQTVDFHTVMGIVGTRMANNTITPDYLTGLVAEINGQIGTKMQSFTDMAALPHAVQYAYSAMVRDGKA